MSVLKQLLANAARNGVEGEEGSHLVVTTCQQFTGSGYLADMGQARGG